MKIALFALFLSLFSACSTAPKNQVSGNSPQAKPIFLWQVSSPQQEKPAPIFLYGTMHLKDRESAYLDKAVVQALGKVSQLHLELHPDESKSPGFQKEVLKAGMLPTGTQLKDVISAENYQTLGLVLEKLKVGEPMKAAMDRMRPWMVAINLAVLSMKAIGSDEQYGSEAQLAALAVQKNKPIAGLETAASQLQALSAGDNATQEYQLVEAMNEILGDKKTAGEGAQENSQALEIRSIYSNGDYPALEAKARELAEDPKSQSFYKLLLTDRNKAMAEKIKALVTANKSSLTAVGALHFAGPGNILELLRKEGFRIKRINPLGKVEEVFGPKAPPLQTVDAEGWTQAKTELFSLKFKGPFKHLELSQPISDKPGQSTKTKIVQMDGEDSFMSGTILEMPADLGESLASIPPDQQEAILKSMAHAAIAPFGKATKIRKVTFPVPGSLIFEYAGEKVGGKVLIFFHQKRVVYLLTGNALALRKDPAVLADELKFFKSLRLLQPAIKVPVKGDEKAAPKAAVGA